MADSKRVVYIVDDDSSIRVGFKRLMEAYGYDTRVFASAGEFLAGGLPGAEACIILDVAMPEMDGLQLQKELVRAGCKAPIIFITALDDPAVREAAKLSNAAFFFRKPVDVAALLDAVKWTLPMKSKHIKEHAEEIAAESVAGQAEPESVERSDTAEVAVAQPRAEACRNKKPEKAVIGSSRAGYKSLCFKVGLAAGKIKYLTKTLQRRATELDGKVGALETALASQEELEAQLELRKTKGLKPLKR